MALYKVTLQEGLPESIKANYKIIAAEYTVFVTGNVRDVAIKTELIKDISDITGHSGQFEPRQILP